MIRDLALSACTCSAAGASSKGLRFRKRLIALTCCQNQTRRGCCAQIRIGCILGMPQLGGARRWPALGGCKYQKMRGLLVSTKTKEQKMERKVTAPAANYLIFSKSEPTFTVPPSLACTLFRDARYPGNFNAMVWIPDGISTRAGVRSPVATPSTHISAPLGFDST